MKLGVQALFCISFLLFAACGQAPRDVEDYGSVAALSATNHPHGYARRDCIVCHNTALGVHQGTGGFLDPSALNQTGKTQGTTSCMSCHGSNGVTP